MPIDWFARFTCYVLLHLRASLSSYGQVDDGNGDGDEQPPPPEDKDGKLPETAFNFEVNGLSPDEQLEALTAAADSTAQVAHNQKSSGGDERGAGEGRHDAEEREEARLNSADGAAAEVSSYYVCVCKFVVCLVMRVMCLLLRAAEGRGRGRGRVQCGTRLGGKGRVGWRAHFASTCARTTQLPRPCALSRLSRSLSPHPSNRQRTLTPALTTPSSPPRPASARPASDASASLRHSGIATASASSQLSGPAPTRLLQRAGQRSVHDHSLGSVGAGGEGERSRLSQVELPFSFFSLYSSSVAPATIPG